MKQNTFRQEIAKQKFDDQSSEERKGSRNNRSGGKSNKGSGEEDSDSSLNSQVNELDLEAEAEYDIRQPQSRGDSFEIISRSDDGDSDSHKNKDN